MQGDAEHLEDPSVAERKTPNHENGSIQFSLTPEVLEMLYNASKKPSPDQPKPLYLANAAGLGFLGFAIADCTFAMVLMGWGGNTSVESVIGIFIFTGPLLLILATIFEWIKGNFLSMMICGFFAVFWFSFGLLNLPNEGIAATYSKTGNAAEGAASVGYNAGIAIYLIALGFTLFTFFIFTLRLNIVMVCIIGFATVGVWLLSGAYWHVSTGNYPVAERLQKAGGAVLFVVGIAGWYMTVVIMCAETGWPIPPVGDLSRFWGRGFWVRRKRNEANDQGVGEC